MDTVRWGLLSTAAINSRLITPIRLSKRGVLAAVASRDEAKAKSYAQTWEIPLAFGSYQSMLDSGQIDAVYISLPNHLHAEWTIRALNAGVHVLCEKPFAITLNEVDRMIAASQRSGRVLAEAFMYRHHPQTKLVGEWVKSGRLGEISAVRGVFNFAISGRDDIRLAPAMGGGSLWDVGCYPLSFAQYVYGEAPQDVFGMQWTGDTGVDETFAGQMQYTGDRMAQITCAFRTPFYTQFEIIGTLGRIVVERPFTNQQDSPFFTVYPKEGQPNKILVPLVELYQGEVEDMHAAILDGAKPYLTLQETRNHVRTLLALYESAASGEAVKLLNG